MSRLGAVPTQKAFTLAEVLITLGIIGVVAAMTIPTLIANTRAQQYRARLKKTISTISQSAKMSQAQYGFDYAGIDSKCGTNAGKENPENVHSICALLNGTLTGATYYENVTDLKMQNNIKYNFTSGPFMAATASRDIRNFRAYLLSDGAILGIYKGLGSSPCTLDVGGSIGDIVNANVNLENCVGFIDVNGVNRPNKEIACSSGSNSLTQNNCIVKNEDITDIYPIRFHDGIVEGASAAARYVIKSSKL